MNLILLSLITFYQRYISPNKGFCCSHQQLYKNGSCSEAIRILISHKGFLKAIPEIRQRFKDCSTAYTQLKETTCNMPKSDLPCDIGIGNCDIGSCGIDNSQSGGYCFIFSGFLSGFSSKNQRWLLTFIILSTLSITYWFYGRQVSNVYIEYTNTQKHNVFQRLTKRSSPEIKVLITANGNKYYSDSIKLENVNTQYKLTFSNSPISSQIDEVKILDARINIGNNLLVIGQVLEEFKNAKQSNTGKHFSYRLKQRWQLF